MGVAHALGCTATESVGPAPCSAQMIAAIPAVTAAAPVNSRCFILLGRRRNGMGRAPGTARDGDLAGDLVHRSHRSGRVRS